MLSFPPEACFRIFKEAATQSPCPLNLKVSIQIKPIIFEWVLDRTQGFFQRLKLVQSPSWPGDLAAAATAAATAITRRHTRNSKTLLLLLIATLRPGITKLGCQGVFSFLDSSSNGLLTWLAWSHLAFWLRPLQQRVLLPIIMIMKKSWSCRYLVGLIAIHSSELQ